MNLIFNTYNCFVSLIHICILTIPYIFINRYNIKKYKDKYRETVKYIFHLYLCLILSGLIFYFIRI